MTSTLFRQRWLIPCLLLLTLIGALIAHVQAHASPTNPVLAAWERACDAGSYHFSSDVTQTTTPLATLGNVGRSSRQDELHLTGQSDLRQKTMELRLWASDGTVVQTNSGVEVRIADGKTQVSEAGGEWRERGDIAESFAPGGDFMSFLTGMRDLKEVGHESRAGFDFTRYSFTVDGPAVARHVRDQMQAEMTRRSELPPGITLSTPTALAGLRGTGEMWIDQRNLPLRLLLNLQFPPQKNEITSGKIDTIFTEYAEIGDRRLEIGDWRLEIPSQFTFSRITDHGSFFATLSFLLISLGGITLIVLMRRSRKLYVALVTAFIFANVAGPLMQNFQMVSFLDAQTAKAAEAEQENAEQESTQSAADLVALQSFDPTVDPIAAIEAQIMTPEGTGTAAIAAATAPLPGNIPTPEPLTAPDNALDSDKDGLTDFLEQRIGTSEVLSDTDDDLILDGQEVLGFPFASRMWYSDPLRADSNKDGQGDAIELGKDANGDTQIDDSDGDGLPDAFDEDNDGDGVLDRHDESPYVKLQPTFASFFNEVTPFQFKLDHLQAGKPVFVDLQLRPRDENHLWYALNVFDWPRDLQGHIQDGDDATFADLPDQQTTDPMDSSNRNANGDLKLIPMLEIRMSAADANAASTEDQVAYSTSLNKFSADGAQQVMYSPLRLLSDEQTGMRLAFAARIPYRASGNWSTPHSVRLVWLVQALLDQCTQQIDGQCALYSVHNQPTVIQSYYDEWLLTGMNVSEEHGTDLAMIYEEPTLDTNKKEDGVLTSLAYILDQRFLSPFDQDGNGQRDMTVAEIARRFDHASNGTVSEDERFALPNTLSVVRNLYDHFDRALMTTAMTETVKILNNRFHSHWMSDKSLKPLIMTAYETQSRSQSLDALHVGDNRVTNSNGILTLDFRLGDGTPLPVTTNAGLKWSLMCVAKSKFIDPNIPIWQPCPSDELLQEIDERYSSATSLLPGDTPAMAEERATLTQLVFLSLSQGNLSVVQEGSTILEPEARLQSDPNLTNTMRTLQARGGSATVDVSSSLIFVVGTLLSPKFDRDALKVGLDGRVARQIHKLAGKGGVIAGSVVGAVTALATVGGLFYFQLSSNRAGSASLLAGTLLIQSFFIASQLKTAHDGIRILMNPFNGQKLTRTQAVTKIVNSASKKLKIHVGGALIGAVIEGVVVWGFFLYQVISTQTSAFSPQFNAALAQAIASTLLIILFTVLSLSVIGTIIVTIMQVIDTIFSIICEAGVSELRSIPGFNGACFTISTTLTVGLSKLLYSFDSMIDSSRPDMILPGAPDIKLEQPARGMVADNPLTLEMPITTTVVNKDPDIQNWFHILPYMVHFSERTLRGTTFSHRLTTSPEEVKVTGGAMVDAWRVAEDHKFAASPMYRAQVAATVTSPKRILPAGINQDPGLVLNSGYSLPAYECWTVIIPLPPVPIVFPVCYTRSIEGSTSTVIDQIKLDILPPTIDGFTAKVVTGNGGQRLAWDARFPTLRDADGDGLRAQISQGIDPNDTTPDGDGDGLTDAVELEWRSAGLALSPVTWDSDDDGLSDPQELQLGSDPTIKDTDNDGLLDGEELYHPVHIFQNGRVVVTNQWAGGWSVTITGTQPATLIVSSEPTRPDSDRDGISDQAEKELATSPDPKRRIDPDGRPYHPLLVNKNPLVVLVEVNDGDRIVKPGQTITYDTIVANLGAPFAAGGLEVRAPALLGAPLTTHRLELDQSNVVTKSTNLVVAASAQTGVVNLNSLARARLVNPSPVPWKWLNATIGSLPTEGIQAHSSAIAPVNFGRQDQYALTGNVRNFLVEPAITAQNVFRGDIRQWAFPSGQSSTLEFDSFNNIALRSNTASDVACNEAGFCFFVWDEFDNCPMISLESIKATAQDEVNGADLAIYLRQDARFIQPGNAERLRLWNRDNLPLNQNQAVALSRLFCGPAVDLEVWEYDSAPPATNPVHGAGIYKLTRLGSTNPAVWVFTGRAQDGQVAAELLARRVPEIPNVIMGSLTKHEPFAINKIRFPVTQSTSNNAVRDFRPVVASDGTNFLVVWERVSGLLSAGRWSMSSQIVGRLYNGSGDPISNESVTSVGATYDNKPQFMAQSFTVLDVAWVGDRYRVVWQAEGRPILRTATINSVGQFESVGVLAGNTNGTLNNTPRIAYEPIERHTLVSYLDPAGKARGILLQAGGQRELLLIDDSLATVQVAYHAAARGWLVGATRSHAFHYRLLTLDGAPINSLPPQSQAWSTTEIATNGASLACPVQPSQPALTLGFEELPGATSFADSSGWGLQATCTGSNCPLAGIEGAPQAPLSDFGATFNGTNQALEVKVPGLSGSTFSALTWLKSNATTGEMGLVGAVDWQVVLRDGKVEFVSNNNTLIGNRNIADGNWHHVGVVQNGDGQNGGEMRIVIDGTHEISATRSGTVQINALANLRIGSAFDGTRFYNGMLDHLQLFDAALDLNTIQSIMNRSNNSYCLAAASGQTLNTMKLNLQEQDVRGGVIKASNGLSLTIDALAPTSQIDSLRDLIKIKGRRGLINTLIVGGSANDAFGIRQVEVSVDGGAFKPISGSSTFVFGLLVGEGKHTLSTRATDVAGNVETTPKSITIFVDADAPTVTLNLAALNTSTLNAASSDANMPSLRLVRSVEDEWLVNLSGTVNDPENASTSGSGVGDVQVLLQGRDLSLSGNDWQSAAQQNGAWQLNYRFPPGLPDVSGYYTLTVQATDGVGNVGTTQQLIYLDAQGAQAELSAADAGLEKIDASVLRLSGVVSDVTGVSSVWVSFTPIRQAMALSGTVMIQPFDEPAGVSWFNDITQFQHDLFCSGVCPTAGEPGKSDKALRFNGQSLLRLGDFSKLNFDADNSFSMQTWFNTTQPEGGLIVKAFGNTGYALRLSGGRAIFQLNGGTIASSANPLNDGQWHHVVAVVDRVSASAQLYVDGKLAGQAPFSGSAESDVMLEVGGGFNGLLDQMAVWKNALTPFRVEGLYKSGDTTFSQATLTQPGALSSGWSISLPLGLEGQYQLDLRAADTLGNRGLNAYAWRGVIDNRQPRIVVKAQPTGASFIDGNGVRQVEIAYDYSASDLHLDRDKFNGPCGDATTAQSEFADDATMGGLFPDLTQLIRLSASCNVWQTSPAAGAVNACDTLGNCASGAVPSESVASESVASQTVSQSASETALSASVDLSPASSVPGTGTETRTEVEIASETPIAQIIKPTNHSYVALREDRLVEMTVVASSGQPLSKLELLLDDAVVYTLDLAGKAATALQRTISVTLPIADLHSFEGEHTLSVRAIDVAGQVQTALNPVKVIFDTHDPVVTLDNNTMTVADAYPTTNSMMRCRGAVNDTLGLATVQMKVNDSGWEDVTFDPNASEGGRWSTAWWVGAAAAGKVLTYHVRAIDRARRVTEVTKSMLTDVPVKPLVQTEITTAPEKATEATSASFEFSGKTSAGVPASSFLCQVDGTPFAACSSPVTYEGLSQGAHLFRVMALDGTATFDGTPAQHRWVVGQEEVPVEMGSTVYLPLVSRATVDGGTVDSGAVDDGMVDGGVISDLQSPVSVLQPSFPEGATWSVFLPLVESGG